MENATRALFIVAGVLIGILILSLGVVLFSNLSSYVSAEHERIEFNELNKFNTQFTNYINYNGGKEDEFEITIQDVVTVASLAYENNIKYANDPTNTTFNANGKNMYVAVYIGKKRIDDIINTEMADMLQSNISNGYDSKKNYRCESKDIEISKLTGRVYKITFQEKK